MHVSNPVGGLHQQALLGTGSASRYWPDNIDDPGFLPLEIVEALVTAIGGGCHRE